MKDLSVPKIKQLFDEIENKRQFDELLSYFVDDSRTSVKKIILDKEKFFQKKEIEHLRIKKMIEFDNSLGYKHVAGVDEVGRGPLAGPVVAACVVMDFSKPILYINDSKKLSSQKREFLYEKILENSLFCSISEVDNKVIDEKNILQATFIAMKSAIYHVKNQMNKKHFNLEFVAVDGNQKIPNLNISQETVIKGDSISYSIACASIIAKVYRDRLMKKMDEIYPGYDFASNVGYGTANHIQGIKIKGLSEIHRKSFCGNLV